MFKDLIKSISDKNNNASPTKKKIENLVVFIVILIFTIICINYILGDKKNTSSSKNVINESEFVKYAKNDKSDELTGKNELEQKLENILSKIEGVGNVEVLITYSQSSETVAMYNEKTKTSSTNEADSTGGTRNVEEQDKTKEIILTEENGAQTPITQTVINPKVEGAIITAKGATNSQVKSNIIQAVEAVTGIATYKIQVFEMKD